MTLNKKVLMWLGQWRDNLPIESIHNLQDVCNKELNDEFNLCLVYSKGDKVIYENEIWVFEPSEKHSQSCNGLIPSNKNHWYMKDSEEYFNMMRSKGYRSVADLHTFLNEQK